ncbi:MAG: chloride channel protein [Clostridia bacterium]|nr:chloride channel protein [Clostridia bacterium]
MLQSILHFLKWLILGALVGVIGGAVGGVFHRLLDLVTEVRTEHSWLILLLPIGGIGIAGLYRLGKAKGKLDTNRVLEAVQTEERVPLTMTPLIFISTILSHLFGASVGREGAALQLGGSLGYNIGRLFRLSKVELHIIVMAGMSSVFSALFGTPLTAAIFAIEVTYIGAVQYSGLFPCIVASMMAYRTALFLGITPVRFPNVAMQAVSAPTMVRALVLAFFCAMVSILLCVAIRESRKYMKKLLPNGYLRALVGGMIIAILTSLLHTTDYNGAGMDVVVRAIGGQAEPEAFLLKILFTAICIGAGFKGGEIVPTLFVGATFGCVAGPLIGLPAGFSAAIGFVALFCGVVNCPIASLMLALEVFGGNLWIFGAVCSVSFLLSGHFGLYKSQKFAVSKLTDEAMES